MTDDEDDRRRIEWEAAVADQLAQVKCPYGGDDLELRRGSEEGPRDPENGNVWACDICDCFGFAKDDERIGIP